MDELGSSDKVRVLDPQGRALSATDRAKAERLLAAGKAVLVGAEPSTIQLTYAVSGAPRSRPQPDPIPVGRGKRILVHVCCAPCATYTVRRLRALEFDVSGLWYNPNVHPYSEHERRRETMAQYARRIDLPVIWEPGYDVVAFVRRIHGQEQFRVRCLRCYEMRLERTAAVAAQRGFDCITSTLLISPHQDQAAIRELGERAAARHGIAFFFENLRQGWTNHLEMTREEGLYSQRYCGCLYSEWEARDRNATTHHSDDV